MLMAPFPPGPGPPHPTPPCRSPAELAGGSGAAGTGPPLWRRKLRRVVALLLLMGVLAVYLDRDLQRQMDALLHQLVRGRTQAPEQHGEL